jgi:uncharacterized damage-inducible protein DinB
MMANAVLSGKVQMMTKTFRKGAIGALLDEYERTLTELIKVIEAIPDEELMVILDNQTEDENCKSVQTILSHVVSSGFGYATSIHNTKENSRPRPGKTFHFTVKEYVIDLTNVFSFTEKVLNESKEEDLKQLDNSLKIKTGWGQLYDTEQLMEHAIVHILRHRRQIERLRNIA